uniref:Uncharacterized protein n=1 Tax=Aegilops tauschii subsp. strangulata TaxID=200361 RepID=A0A453SNK4_AEGTS
FLKNVWPQTIVFPGGRFLVVSVNFSSPLWQDHVTS